MSSSNKPKVTIGADGSIHVDNKGKSATTAGATIDRDGTIHIDRKNIRPAAQTKSPSEPPRKTTSQLADSCTAATANHSTELRDTETTSGQQSPKRKEPLPRLLVGVLIGLAWGLMLIGSFAHIWLLVPIGAVIGIATTIVDDERG